MSIEHQTIEHDQCHEPRHITISTTGDAGKVITPSAVMAGTSVLRVLLPSEVGALSLAGGTTTGKININHADGLEVLGVKVVGAQGAVVADQGALTITEIGTPGSADTASVQAAVDALIAKINTLTARLRAHGLIAT